MAYTKIHAIKSTVGKAIDYITNGEKTDNNILISTFACSRDTADMEFEMTRNKFEYRGVNLAYHCIQSFKPNEVTPEQAHSIGVQLADELLKGRYEYVVATHIDKGHVHNHILINGCNFENGLSFGYEHNRKNNPHWKKIRKISDDICLENKLSVIAMPEKGYGKCYYEWLQEQNKNSYKSKLKNVIDKCIMTSDSFDDFLNKMKEEDYKYRLRGNSLSFRAKGQERFTRCSRKRLGWYYEPEQLKKRIERQVKKRTAVINKDNGFYQVRDENAVGLNRWAALKNMQEASRLLNLLSDCGVGSVEQLEEKISEQYDRRFDITERLNDYEKSVREQRELLKMLNTYWETKAVHDEYMKSKNKSKFNYEHSRELLIYDNAKDWLRDRYTGSKLPNRSVIEMKIAEQESKRDVLLEEYKSVKKSISYLENIHGKIETYLETERKEQEKKKSKGELE